ncbi:MAG: cupin domain-containing protein [Acidobacteria bacterium]|nr:cupin domain-containing protein [Acidobacteriota bacterium]
MQIAQLARLVSEASDPNTFVGRARLTRLPGLSDDPAVHGFRVEFQPAARTNWHTHSGPQLLIVVAGTCRLQKDGEAVIELASGDVACIAPGERHWHGASPDGPMTHVAINISSRTTWLEPVSDAEYSATDAA